MRLIKYGGWIGVCLVLSGYILLTMRIFGNYDIRYQILNATGAALIAVEAWTKKDYQPFWLNVIWMGVALFAILSNAIQ